MYTASTEIYSDQTNAAIMRHPDRKFPGVLVQGDTLYSLCVSADASCQAFQSQAHTEEYQHLNDLRNHLRALLSHYKAVLTEHQLPLPFSEVA
jgi:hypothetical protein